jgi:hypothetical protein
MIRIPGGATLSFSRKQFGVTPNTALETEPEKGRSILMYPQRFTSLHDIQSEHGMRMDASSFPFAQGHEDIVVLAAADDTPLGWSAALAKNDGFLFFAIKDATLLPETLLWMSNGGRYYPPWSSRHTHVLGIEEAATSCHQNHDFSSSTGRSAAGLNMGLTLAETRTTGISYCVGAIPVPAGWQKVSDIRINSDSLTLQDVSGDEISLPFAGDHFGLQ